MVAIVTKFYGPTNTRGSRIVATTANGQRQTINYDHAYSAEYNHQLAARKLATVAGWKGKLASGATAHGYAHVWISRDSRDLIFID